MFDILNFAYLDAGTGSLIIQSLIGAIAGIIVFGRNAIARVGDKTRKLFGGKSETKSEAAESKAE